MCDIELLRHGVLLVFVTPSQLLTLAKGQEHGRTIPLCDNGRAFSAPALVTGRGP